MKRIWILALMMSLLLNACGTGTKTGMETHSAWTRPAVQGEDAAVYFALHNHSANVDELIDASTDVAESVNLQESPTNRVDSIPVKAFADMEFTADGSYLMLVNLKKDLQLDDQFMVTLHFKNSKDIKARVSVRATPPPAEE